MASTARKIDPAMGIARGDRSPSDRGIGPDGTEKIEGVLRWLRRDGLLPGDGRIETVAPADRPRFDDAAINRMIAFFELITSEPTGL